MEEPVRRAICALWIALGTLIVAAIPAVAQQQDNRGTEFMLGFMHNFQGASNLTLFVTGDTETSGLLEIPSATIATPFNVTPGSVTSVNVDLSAMVIGTDTITGQGIRVTANDEIVVYGLNQQSATTDAFLGLPTDILDTEHIVLSFESTHLGLESEFLIVGVQDGTTVTITPSIATGARAAGVPYNITLDRFDTYQLKGDAIGEDLSGSIIMSDQPVAVFGGSQCTNVPTTSFACDHLVEQLPPTTTWGASFLTVPLATRTGGDFFRIIARDDGTQVRIDGVLVATIDRAAFHQADLASGTFHEIEATGPVMVMQYSKGTTVDGVRSDPFMMMVPPTQQFQRRYTLTTPAAAPVIFINFINVVVATPDAGSCMIDGVPFTAAFSSIGTSGFSAVQEPVAIGSHEIACPSPFGAYSYGFAQADSYGYPGGLALENIAEKRVVLTPELALNPLDTDHTVTALVTENVVDPLAEREVTFEVVSGPNAGDGGFVTTDENGEADFTYPGDGGKGVDEIVASCFNEVEDLIESNTALKFWDNDCNNNQIADTCDINQFGFGGRCDEFPGAGGSADENEDGVPDECEPTPTPTPPTPTPPTPTPATPTPPTPTPPTPTPATPTPMTPTPVTPTPPTPTPMTPTPVTPTPMTPTPVTPTPVTPTPRTPTPMTPTPVTPTPPTPTPATPTPPTATPTPNPNGAVLILGPTVFNGADSNEAVNAIALGFDVDVVTAGQWAELTTEDFASYRALILGDPFCGGIAAISAAEANREVWSPAVTGNVALVGTDPTLHAGQGGSQLNNSGINFATSGDGTGLYATLSCYYDGTEPMTNVPVLDQFGAFTVTHVTGCFDDAHIVAESPALAGLTDELLSNWGCSVHEAFDSFPPTFVPLAIAEGEEGPGSLNFADESFGIPYILARGASPVMCGDGVLDIGFEQCDDGNNEDGDGCSAICRVEDRLIHGPFTNLSGWPEVIQLNDGQDRAYIGLRENGVDIDGIENRDAPSALGNYTPTAGDCPEGFAADELVLLQEGEETVAVISGESCGVVGADVSNPASPSFIDRAAVPNGLVEEVVGLETETETFLFAVAYGQGLQIFSVDDGCTTSGCAVTQRGSIGVEDDDWGVSLAIWLEVFFTEGGPLVLVYVASSDGLQIVDVTDPDNPVLLGRYDTNPTDIPLADQDDVPQDIVVARNFQNGRVIAYLPLWIGGFLVIDVTDPTNPVLAQPVIPASAGSAFFKVEVSSQRNRIYATEGIYGLTVFIQNAETGELDPIAESRFPIGVGDANCSFDGNGVADVCWTWAVDEVNELVGVTYGVFDSPLDGGYQLITQTIGGVGGQALAQLGATPVPEPHALLLQGVGVAALAGLARLRRRAELRRSRSS